MRTASSIDAAPRTGTDGGSAAAISGDASPIATTDAWRATSGARSVGEVAALEPPAEDHDQPVVDALDGPRRRLDVGGLRVVDEADALDRGDRLERVLEAGESLDGAHHRLRR